MLTPRISQRLAPEPVDADRVEGPLEVPQGIGGEACDPVAGVRLDRARARREAPWDASVQADEVRAQLRDRVDDHTAERRGGPRRFGARGSGREGDDQLVAGLRGRRRGSGVREGERHEHSEDERAVHGETVAFRPGSAARLSEQCRTSVSPPPTGRPATSLRRSRCSPRACSPATATRRCSAPPGTGKTATMAWIVERVQKPTLVIAHNKTLAAQLCNEFREFFPDNAVEYFVSYYDYYQPEAYVPAGRPVHREGRVDQRRHRPPPARRHERAAPAGATCVIVASVSCIYGARLARGVPQKTVLLSVGRGGRPRRTSCASSSTSSTSATTRSSAAAVSASAATSSRCSRRRSRSAYRISFFGDEVEQISHFDPLTGRGATAGSSISPSSRRRST